MKKQQDIEKIENNKNNVKKQQETTNMKYILEVFDKMEYSKQSVNSWCSY